MVFMPVGSLLGSTDFTRILLGAIFASAINWRVTLRAVSNRWDFVRTVRVLDKNFFGAALKLPRKTKTLAPPVISLIATRSCAPVGIAHKRSEKMTPKAKKLLVDPNIFFIFYLISGFIRPKMLFLVRHILCSLFVLFRG